jgi:hypothetical protein
LACWEWRVVRQEVADLWVEVEVEVEVAGLERRRMFADVRGSRCLDRALTEP